MKAEILAVGTELLLGDIVNTNAQYISKKLAALGIDVHFQTVVGDNEERLSQAVKNAFGRADLIITSGGLGPVSYTHLCRYDFFFCRIHKYNTSFEVNFTIDI